MATFCTMIKNPDFIVHNLKDTVGVIVVETLTKGKELKGWVMENDDHIKIKAKDDIPLGHKIALVNMKVKDTVIKYGHDIGVAIADIENGKHVHVFNVKTKR